ncbi:hypothetical protein MYP_3514 [Sporocytophaga myxococcoides]|uniref:DUF3224 domain-containing protein n=1 Tax=Sporocytophaga myxococcoides TaxID=153721 RepID=A0A098LH72_9BACT|nr:hypothetical protein MYP_3514 [Sporocytophaga myxococcoides]
MSALLTVKSKILKSLMIDGQECSQASYVCLYEGEIHGTGIVATLPFGIEEQIYGIERFSGNIGEKSGTFVLENYGYSEIEEGKTIKKIVPGSGTNDFLGIKGDITLVSAKDKKVNIAVQLEFDTKLTKED